MALSQVEKKRKQLKFFSWSGASLVAAIIILVNFIVSYLPIRFDSSEGDVYSVSAGTKTLLTKLDDNLIVRVMFSSQLPPAYKLNEKYLSDLLAEYKRASHGKIKIEYFDPGKSPKGRQEAISYGVAPVQLDVRERDRREVKECFMGVAFLYGDKKGAIPIIQDSQNLEYEITVQIKKMIDPKKPIVGIGKAGGALNFNEETLQPLSDAVRQLYTIQDVDLTLPIPSDVKALWIIGPNKTLDPIVNDHLKAYISSGGTVGLLLDTRNVVVNEFRTNFVPLGIDPFLLEAGLSLMDGLIFDPRCDRVQVRATQGAFQMINIVDYPFIPVIVDLNRTHPTTKGIEAFTMAYASPIEINGQKPNLSYTILARSSEMSHLENNPFSVNPLNERYRHPDAKSGPFNVAVIAEGRFGSQEGGAAPPGRLILFSSSRFIRAEYPVKQSNFSLFMNMLDWSVQDEVLLQIRSKGLVQKPLKTLSDGVRLFIKTLIMVVLPLLSLLMGIIVWQKQKIRRALLPLNYKDLN